VANAVKLRQTLAHFLGSEQFRKFVQHLNKVKRLRFWQREAWNRFLLVHPEFNVTDEDLIASLRICWLHGSELKLEEVTVIDGHVDYTDSYVRTQAREFPHSALRPVYSEGAPHSRTVTVWFCSDCRKAEAAWMARRA
jgi:hypothetical protein